MSDVMKKPVRLEINNSGAWKVIGRFDAANEDAADAVLNAAGDLAAALNDPASGRTGLVTLRVSMAEAPHDVLMYWESMETGWRDRTGAPV